MAEYENLNEENNTSGRQGSAQRLSCLPCTDPLADVTVKGCCDPTQVNYNSAATCDDGSCQPFTYGCTDPTATNYNAANTAADGSCVWLGCLNPTATNYMGLTSTYAGILPGPYYGGTEWGNAVDDGSCADGDDWYSGCTDPTALNYDPSCLADPSCYSCFLNNCCNYPVPDVYGCTDSTADNYDSTANIDDGSCILYDCTDPSANNYSGYSSGSTYTFPSGVVGTLLSDTTLCRYTNPAVKDCTLVYAQIVAENIIWDTNRWLNGTLASLQSWVENHWYYQPVGYIPSNSTPLPCKWFEKMVDKFTNQISDHFAGIPPHANWGPNLLAKKQAILEYFIEMQAVCECNEERPTTFQECQTIIVDKNRYYKYEHNTDTTTPLMGVGPGTQSIHNIEQPYDVAAWGGKFYAVVEDYDPVANTLDWVVKEYLVNWTNNTYTFLRDIIVNNAISNLPQAYTMKDANTMLVMTQFPSLYPKQAIVAIDITTNIAPAVGVGGTAVVIDWINFPNTNPNQGGDITCYDDDTMLVSFSDSDLIRHYYMDSAGAGGAPYAGAGPISNATVPSIYGTVGHYTFDNDTYIITINNSGVNEVRQVTVPAFTVGGPMVISPVLTNVIPNTEFIRGADTTCFDDAQPCDLGMDVVFLLDYTGSMGGITNTIKNNITSLVNTIDTLTGYSNYRLSLITVDEELDTTMYLPIPNYANCPDYINLPAAQKLVNMGPMVQVITAWEVMDSGLMNNGTSFTTQLNKLNGGAGGNCIQIGNGSGSHEPTALAAEMVAYNNFAGAFRNNVANYVVIITDNLPSLYSDYFTWDTWLAIQALIVQAQADGVKYFVCGGGATMSWWFGSGFGTIQPWVELTTQTGGAYTTSFDANTIANLLEAGCTDVIF